MLDLLFYLLLQLGLLGGPTQNPNVPNPDTTKVEAESSLQVESSSKDVKLGTDVNIGGSGWDDKN